MSKEKSKADHIFESSFDEHRIAQIKRWAKETTPQMRLQWLEEAIKFAHKAGIDYLKNKSKNF